MSKKKNQSIKHLRLPLEPKIRAPRYIIEHFAKSGHVRYLYKYTRQAVRDFKKSMRKGGKAHVFLATFNYIEGFKK